MSGTRSTVALVLQLLTAGCSRADPSAVASPADDPRVGFELPASAAGYREHSTGLQATMVQARFEMNAAELGALVERLPCRLGPVSTTPTAIASVGTNDRSWWRPERSRRHRECTTVDEQRPSLHETTVLVDLTQAQHPTVYVLVTDD